MKKNVCVFNQNFTVVCEESESLSIDKAQARFNEAISTVKSHISGDNRERILLMAGLLMAQELLIEHDQIQAQITALLDNVNNALKK